MPAFHDLTGMQFSFLKVIERDFSRDKYVYWLCECTRCGKMTSVRSCNLVTGQVMSCGCYGRSRELRIRHGDSRTSLYERWCAIKNRCKNESCIEYKNYGGRGIKMCEEWSTSYETFKDWAISHGYREDLTIDRIDVNGDYCPENCRWITMKEQLRNTTKTMRITYNGKTMLADEWEKVCGIKQSTIRDRIRHGWTPEEALTIKPIAGNNQTLRKKSTTKAGENIR